MSEMEKLARALMTPRGGGPDLVMGQILSGAPNIRVLVEGLSQDRDSLLVGGTVDLTDLEPGDQVALWPIEDHQRYVILAKVVDL